MSKNQTESASSKADLKGLQKVIQLHMVHPTNIGGNSVATVSANMVEWMTTDHTMVYIKPNNAPSVVRVPVSGGNVKAYICAE